MSKKDPQNGKNGKTERPRFLIPNDPFPLRIYGDLAAEIGLGESILLLQLEFLIATSTSESHDGDIWTYQSLEDLQRYCKWYSLAGISKIIKKLECNKYIKVANFNKVGWDRTRWFALNPEGINTLKSIRFDSPIYTLSKCNRDFVADATATKCKSNRDKVVDGSATKLTTLPETPTETFLTQTPTEISSSSENEFRNVENQSQEEEGPQGPRYFSDSFVQKLMDAGVFDNKIKTAEILAIQKGWTESKLEEFLKLCYQQDKEGTPGALFLHRLAHRKPPKEKDFSSPGAWPTIEEVKQWEIDSVAVQIWSKAKLELQKTIHPTVYKTWFENGSIVPWIDNEDVDREFDAYFTLTITKLDGKDIILAHRDQIEAAVLAATPEKKYEVLFGRVEK